MTDLEKKLTRRRVPKPVIIILSVIIPIGVLFAALYVFGMHVHNEARIYPNVTISGTDISGMTRSEAVEALNVADYDERTGSAKVILELPDGSERIITGADANLHHDSLYLIVNAFNSGRGRGVIPDVLEYLYRQIPNRGGVSFDIDVSLDEDLLRTLTDALTYAYNLELDASGAQVLDDRIVFTKGAGHVNADSNDIFLYIYNGLFESFETGVPIEIRYELPPAGTIVDDVLGLRELVFAEAVNSEFDRETNTATASNVGVDIDIFAAAEILANTEYGRTVEFELLFTYPEYSQEELESILFRDLIGERTTYVHGSSARLNNVALSAEFINGYVMLPGEEFSFNRVVGQRTREAGFQAAPAIVGGGMSNVLGGGVCQTSSTLFASIRPSELNVTEQRRHSRPVPYLPWGWDAAIWYGAIDLRFENNTDYPLLLVMEVEDRNLTARVYGTIVDDFPIAR